jgi:D-alanyl-D-alanine carboxypeptidase
MPLTWTIVALAALATGATGSLAAQSDRATLIARIDSLANVPIARRQAAGLSLAVVRGHDTLLLKGYGKADLELDTPTPDRAVYEIGSVTKQFTSAAILQLVERGRIALDDELIKYLPSYPTQGHTITIRRLMDHTSGIKGYTELPAFWSMAARKLPRDTLVALFAKEPFDFAPGDAMVYNNSAYFLLGLVIEKVSGRPYAEYVKDSLFTRAGMPDSRYCSESVIMPRKVHGYDYGPAGLQKAAPIDHTWPFSAGSLCSTAGDLLAWTGALHGGRILGPEAYRELVTPGALNDGTRLRYAKGLALSEIAGHRAISHGGGIFGFTSFVTWLPDDSLTVVALLNSAGPAAPDDLVEAIVALLVGRKQPEPVPYAGDLAQLAGVYQGVGRGQADTVTFAVAEGALTIRRRTDAAQPLIHIGNGVFSRGSARYTFLRRDGKVTGVRTDLVAVNAVLARQ